MPPTRLIPRHVVPALITLALCLSTSRARAADDIRIDEFNITCVNGFSNAAFVELVANSPGQVYDDGIRLRFLNSNGSIRYEMPIGVSALAGQSWPQGRRWLIGYSNFFGSTQVAPDAEMSNVPASTGGAVLLVRLNTSGGAALVLDRVDYTSTGAIPAPTLGRSLQRQPDLSWQLNSAPDPTTAAGTVATAASCYQATNLSARVNELALLCRNGLISGQFIELTSTSTSGTRDAALRLRTYDRNGILISDLTDVFGASAGQPWANGTEWLIAPATLKGPQGQSPDRVLSAPMDTVGGRILFVRREANGSETVLSDVRYGTPTLPRPGYGKSLSYSSGYLENPLPTPKGSNALIYSDPLCDRPLPSSAYLSELQLQCFDGSATTQFLELGVTGTGEQLWPELTLEAFDRNGQSIGTILDPFGALKGAPWSVSQRWLLATLGFRDNQQRQPNLVLPFALDLVGGRIILRDGAVPPSGTVLSDLRYGTGGVAAPAPGHSLEWNAGAYTERSTPAPTGFAGTAYSDALCGRAPIALGIREIQFRCANGSTTGQFVELGLNGGDEFFDPRVDIMFRDHAGTIQGRLTQPFAARASALWPSARPWLIATTAYRTSGGAAADAILPTTLDTLGGSVEFVQVRNGVDFQLSQFIYGSGGVPMPAFGRSLVASGSTFIESTPTPNNYDLLALAPEVACIMPFQSGAVLDEVQLLCANGQPVGQFIELRSTLLNERFDARHRVRAYNRDGVLIGEVALTSASPGNAWSQNTSYLIANPIWQAGRGPDLVLPFALDAVAGRIELLGPYGSTNTALLGALSYGHDGELSVAPGKSFVRVSGSTYTSSDSPTPTGTTGTIYTAGRCSAPAIAPVKVAEFGSGCFGGGNASFIELRSGAGAYHDADVTLIVRDHLGVELGRTTNMFAAYSGTPWPLTRRWLLGNTAFVDANGGTVGTNLPFALDTEGGAIVLQQTGLDGIATVDSISYGPGHEAPAPTAGMSVSRAVYDGPFAASFPTPTSLEQVTVGASCFDPRQWPIRISEFSTACSNGGSAVQFVELTTLGSGFAYYSTLRLRVYDSTGGLLGEVARIFPAFENSPWSLETTVLLGHTGVGICAGIFDADMGPLLDPLGGQLVLVAVTNGLETVVQSLAYGQGGEVPAPPAGQSAARQTDGSYQLQPIPTPRNRAGVSVVLPACDYTPPPIRIELFALGCASGHDVGQFVELRSTAAFTIPPGLFLQYTRPDNTTGEVAIASTQIGQVWPAGRPLLFTSLLWPSHLGRCSDATIASMHTATGALRLVERAGSSCSRILEEVTYGAGQMIATPLPGVGIRHDSSGPFVHEPWPTPTCANGDTTWLVPCLGSDPEQTVVVQEFAVMDAAYGRLTQFIELSSSRYGQLSDRRVGVRTYNSTGQLLQTVLGSSLYSYGGQWRPGVPHILTNTTTNLSGNYVERVLATLDTLGGRIELIYQPSNGGPLQSLRSLSYGPGTDVPAPGPGYSAQRMPDGTYVSTARPTPANLLGILDMSSYPVASCEIASLMSSTGENEPVGTATFDRLQVIAPTRSTFDKTRGTVSSSAGPGMIATTVATDRFVLEAPAGASVNAVVRMVGVSNLLCDTTGCATGYAYFALIVNGATVSRQLSTTSSTAIDIPVTLTSGVPFTVGQSVAAAQTAGPGFTRRVFGDTRLEFVGIPAGLRVTSCSGFVQDQAVPVLLALAEAVAAADHTRLVWRVEQAADFDARVQRSEVNAEWIDVGTVRVNGQGELAFEDRSVLPLHRYGYRLAWSDPVRGALTAGEAWLDIPQALAFALHGARPNPTRGALTVAFQLAREGDVRLELLDIAGRRALEHRASGLAPGNHTLTLARPGEVAPGMYVLRLHQGERSASTRVIITR